MNQKKIVLLIAILASFVAFLDGSVVNVALPAIARQFQAGFTVQQWVVDAYAITLGSLMLLAGSLSDLLGRQRIMKLGLIIFGLASLLCAVAPSSLFLIISRALQGVGGALLVPSSLALIMSAYPAGERSKAIGTWTAWTGIAFLVGPLVGGLLIDAVSWRLVFAINVLPIYYTLFLLRRCRVEEPNKPSSLDLAGALLGAFGLAGAVFALIEQSHFGWSSPVIYLSLIMGIVLLLAFMWRERTAKQPMMPFSLFRERNFSAGNVATFAIYAGLAAAQFVLVIFLQQIGHYSATLAGLAITPVMVLMFFLSSRFGALAGRFGPRWFMAGGPLLISVGFLAMLLVGQSANYLVLLPGILLFGLGLSITVAPLTSAVLESISERQSGIASAVNNAISRIAGLIAIAALSPLIGRSLGLSGFRSAMILSAGLMATGAVVSAVGIVNPPKTMNKEVIIKKV